MELVTIVFNVTASSQLHFNESYYFRSSINFSLAKTNLNLSASRDFKTSKRRRSPS
jgi:hypothetical protein